MGEHHAAAMSEERVGRAIDLLFEASDRPALAFFGGEPLLAWERLVFAVERAERLAAERGAPIEELQLTTNATLLTDERARFLKDHRVKLAVSVDGDRAAHESGRPQKGGGSSFDAVSRGMAVLVENGVPFDAIAVTTPENAARLAESVAFLVASGARRVILSPAFERAWSDAELAAWEPALEVAGRLHADVFRATGRGPVATFETKIIAALNGRRASECSVGRWSVALAPSGNLYPCERLVGEDRDARFVIGHLDDGLTPKRSIDRGPKAAECEPCPERYRCSSGCACANVAETGEPTLPGGVQCWYEQVVARVSDGIAEDLLDDPRFVELAYPSGPGLGLVSAPPTPDNVGSVPRRRHLPLRG